MHSMLIDIKHEMVIVDVIAVWFVNMKFNIFMAVT
jgi:hypothetical protein